MTMTRRKSIDDAYVSGTKTDFHVDNKTGKEKKGLIFYIRILMKLRTYERSVPSKRTFLVFSSSTDIFLA